MIISLPHKTVFFALDQHLIEEQFIEKIFIIYQLQYVPSTVYNELCHTIQIFQERCCVTVTN